MDKDSTCVFYDFIKNTGTDTLHIYSMAVKGKDSSSFQLNFLQDSVAISPKGSIDLNITCMIKDTGFTRAYIEFNTNADSSGILKLQAFGTLLNLSFVDEVDFGNVLWEQELPADSTIFTYNYSNILLTVDTIRIIGPDSVNFSYGQMSFPIHLNQNDSLEITVGFNHDNMENRQFNSVIAIHLNEFDTTYCANLKCNYTETSVRDEIIQNLRTYPNPAINTINIKFNLETPEIINLTVYNTLGYQVAVLADDYLYSGNHKIFFDASNLPTGTYYYVLKAGSRIETGKLLLIK